MAEFEKAEASVAVLVDDYACDEASEVDLLDDYTWAVEGAPFGLA